MTTRVVAVLASAVVGALIGLASTSSPQSVGAPVGPLAAAVTVGTTEVGPGAGGLVSDGDSVWVSDELGVERIDAASGDVVLSASAGANAAGAGGYTEGMPVPGLATDGRSPWVASYTEDRVAPLDPTNARVDMTRAVSVPGPSGMVMVAGSLWVVTKPVGEVMRIDAMDGHVVARLDIGTRPGLIGGAVDRVWAVDADGNGVTRIDTADDSVDRIPVPLGSPTALAIGAGSVWVGTADGTLVGIDEATGRVSRVQIEPRPGIRPSIAGIAVADRDVWVTGSLTPGAYGDILTQPGFVERLDRSTLTLADAWQVDGGAFGGVLAGGSLWMSVGFSSVIRIAADDAPVADTPLAVGPTAPRVAFTPDVIYATAADGSQLPLDVYAPPGARLAPVVVLVPGAPGTFQPRRYLSPLAAALAGRGAVVLDIDIRSQATGATSLDDSLADLACAIAWAREHAAEYGGDAGSVVAAGHSVGSQLVLWEVLYASDYASCAGAPAVPDAVVAIAQPDVMDPGDIVPAASGVVPPLWIVTGELDQADLAARLNRALRGAGYDSTLDIVPGADHHSIIDARDSVPTLRIILDAAGSRSPS